MKIIRSNIEVSDISVEIACKLCNRWMLDLYECCDDHPLFVGLSRGERQIFQVEEAAIIIDQAIKDYGTEVLEETE